ncbi:MAG: uspA [Noviherbaspirillum sp.]|nr:uspA [Noviherbaspirillum sp.]
MFKTILVPTDGSELSEKAAHAAIEFAKSISAKLVTVSVAEPVPLVALVEGGAPPPWIDDFEESARKEAQARVDRVAAAASAAGVPCDKAVALSISPYEEIIAAAQRFACELIFMASHGRKGLSRRLLGSETQKVLAHTTIPVLVYR